MPRIVWQPDYTALIASFAYVAAVIALGEVLRRTGRRPADFTRKFIHIGVGMWVIGTVLLFRHWYFAIIPPAAFILINAASYAMGAIKAMESGDRANLGTIYFPISFAALIYLFWAQPVVLVASLMPMTWGDAMAAILGRRYGHYFYSVAGHRRSLEGSLVMLLFSWVATGLALGLMPYALRIEPMNWLVALIYSGAVALGCTLVEAVSPWGIDNLTVPAVAAAVLYLLHA